jgi:exonuclease SbcD
VATFAGVDYVALGHLHGAQTIAPGVRYSGSPLAYSFSEESHTKSVTLVDMDATGIASVETVACPVPRPLARVRGRLDELLSDGRWGAIEGHYLQVTLTDPQRPRDPMERLRARFPHTLVLLFDPDGGQGSTDASYSRRLRGLDDLAISASFVEHVRRSPATEDELALFAGAFEAQRLAEAAG